MTTKELYNHFNNNVYSKLSWGTDLTMVKTLNKVRSEIKTVDEKPNPNRRRKNYPLRTFEYNDFRFVETLSTAAGDRGNIYHIPTGELIGDNATYFDFNTFVWWFYNHR